MARTRYEQAANQAVQWLVGRLRDDDSYGLEADDLACYYKSPYLFSLSGRPREASRLLSFIRRRFMRADHDFTTAPDHKSDNAVFTEYWAYPNGWLAMAAARMGRFDVAYPAFDYLRSYHHSGQDGFCTCGPFGSSEGGTDALTTAHLGLLCLYLGDIERASGAGRWLARLLGAQPDLGVGLLLRRDRAGHLVDEFPADKAAFHVVRTQEPSQAYFMIGYPIAFLGKLFDATGDYRHLQAAHSYLDFALSCNGNLRSCPTSHKVAWGAAVLSRITGDSRCTELSIAIADYLLDIQDRTGAWLTGQPAHITFDQTAEIAIWLQEISAELKPLCDDT